MTETTFAPLALSSEELAILSELLEAERNRLLVEIRTPITGTLAASCAIAWHSSNAWRSSAK